MNKSMKKSYRSLRAAATYEWLLNERQRKQQRQQRRAWRKIKQLEGPKTYSTPLNSIQMPSPLKSSMSNFTGSNAMAVEKSVTKVLLYIDNAAVISVRVPKSAGNNTHIVTKLDDFEFRTLNQK